MIENLRMARLSEALRLNEEEAARMAVRMRELAEERERVERERREIMPRMRELLEKADFERRAASEKDLQPLLDRLRALQEETSARLRDLEARLMEGLSAERRARMILFQRDFEREVNEMIRLARIAEPPPPPPR
ncbi:MAG: hypothetical protein FJY88_09665 [Candidatus Eisenbacteria bacterium]|nr:hypothetical protein [Candidatus Eisenbacteria bacterium]